MRASACRDSRDGFPIERSSGATVTISAIHECDDVTRARVIWAVARESRWRQIR